jgi:HK97 family phage prohead protease
MPGKFIAFRNDPLKPLNLKDASRWRKEGASYKLLNPDPEKDRQFLHVNFKKMGGFDQNSSLLIAGVANANIVDRMQERLDPRGLITEHFMKNPQLLAHHSYYHPVGQVEMLDVQDDGVHFSAWIGNPEKAPLTEMQKEIRSLVAQGILKTVSVGFIPHKIKEPVYSDAGEMQECPVIESWELLELSIVAVPANQDSVFGIKDCLPVSDGAKVKGNVSEQVISLNDNPDMSKTAFEQALDSLAEQDMIIQSLIFSKAAFKTAEEAKKWASEHGFKVEGVDETEDSFRIRQRDPSEFDESTLRTIDITEGVKAVAGKTKTEGTEKPKPGEEEQPDKKQEDLLPMLEKITGMLDSMMVLLQKIAGDEGGEVEAGKKPDEEKPSKEDEEKKALKEKLDKLQAGFDKLVLTLEALAGKIK